MTLRGDRAAISFRPEVKAWAITRNITPTSALELASLMLRAGTLPETIKIESDPAVALQVQGGSERYAWLRGRTEGSNDEPDLVACITGYEVLEIGRCLHDLYLSATRPDQMPRDRAIFVREVTAFYLRYPDDRSFDRGGRAIVAFRQA